MQRQEFITVPGEAADRPRVARAQGAMAVIEAFNVVRPSEDAFLVHPRSGTKASTDVQAAAILPALRLHVPCTGNDKPHEPRVSS
jgi:hypothetical protein